MRPDLLNLTGIDIGVANANTTKGTLKCITSRLVGGVAIVEERYAK